MKTLWLMAIAALVLVASPCAYAEDLTFKKTKIVVVDGDKTKQVPVIVTWSDSTVSFRLKKSSDLAKYGQVEREIPYSGMSNLTYEHSKHWRVASAILLSPLTLFSRRKHHWFSFEYKDESGKSDAVVLRIDKKEELIYRRRVPALTGLKLDIVED